MTRSDDLIIAFRRATHLKVDIDMTPKFRRRKRRRLEAEFARACREADEAREAIGVEPGAPGIREIIEQGNNTAARELRSAHG